jgi:hypothetical protein
VKYEKEVFIIRTSSAAAKPGVNMTQKEIYGTDLMARKNLILHKMHKKTRNIISVYGRYIHSPSLKTISKSTFSKVPIAA